MKRVMRGALVFVLAVMLVITSVPGALFTTVSAAAGPADGQVEYSGGSNSTPAGSTYDIAVSKTIKAVSGKENYFDITLKTTTHRHHVDMSTDVVIVMDISNTMNNANKLNQAKDATNQFIKQFCEDTKLSSDRKLGVVTFNTNAEVAVGLQEANSADDYTSKFKNKVSGITAPDGINVKFTNIEGGLQLANNILAASDARFKFVILLTDGFPTTYIQSNGASKTKINGYDTYMSNNSDYSSYKSELVGKKSNGILKTPGYMANVTLGKPCLYGVDYSDYGAQRAQAVANTMKNSNNINIFSVGIGVGGMTIQKYLDNHKGKIFSTVDTNGRVGSGNTYTIGDATNTNSYKLWLGDKIAGGKLLADNNLSRYSDGDNAAQLKSAYSNILKTIERAPETTMREFYTLDPMSDVADFVGFYDKNGKLSTTPNKLTGESKENAENTAIFGGSGNSNRINWNMLKSGFTMDGENLVFTLKYRVRLMNEKSDFKWDSAYDMNKKTTLNYSQKYVDNGESVPDGTGVIEYPIPETEGYKGKLKFKKVDAETGRALANVEFVLQHYNKNCSVCKGDASIADRTAKTDKDGHISFDNIPSGHEYALIEKEPEGYAPVHNHAVIVSYGDTYIGTKTAANKLVNDKLNGKDFIIENSKKEPVEIKVTAQKTVDGSDPEVGAFQFLMKGKDVHGADHHEVVTNDAEGNIAFAAIVYDKIGTYEYEISEVVGNDAGIIYDDTKHELKIVVIETADKKAYQAEVSVDGKKIGTYVGEDNVIETVNVGSFSNISRTDGKAVIFAEKIYEDGVLKANEYEFKIQAATADAPLPAKTTVKNTAGGNVSFGEISYDKPGKYEYIISEIAGDNNSIVYDKTTFKATVTVTAPKDLTNHDALQTVVKYSDAQTGKSVDSAVFTNKDRELPTITMNGVKTMNGRPAKANEFTFVIQEVDDEGVAIGSPAEIKNGDNGIISFDSYLNNVVEQLIAEINDPGNTTGVAVARNYKIYEKAGTATGVEYDEKYYVLQLGAIVDDSYDHYDLTAIMQKVDGDKIEGIFDIEASNDIQVIDNNKNPLVKFENTSKVELELEATKRLESTDTVMKADDYTFVLEDINGNKQYAKNDSAGNIRFKPLEFTANDAGKHSFVIYEEEGNNLGLFYDDSIYTVTVDVNVNEYGEISITEPGIIDEYEEVFTDIVFVNKDLDPTHLHLNAVKTIDGDMPTVAQKFTFELLDDNGSTPAVIEEIQNVHEKVAFSSVELDSKGTYKYIVREKLPADDDPNKAGVQNEGYTFDENEYHIKAIVTDENNDGILEKKITVNGKEDPAEHNTVTVGVFDNTYEAAPVDVCLDVSKQLSGRDWIKGDSFSFNLEPADKETVDAITAGIVEGGKDTVSIDYDTAGKKSAFDKITFKEAGTYKFIIEEEGAGAYGITYDTHKVYVTVTVTDSGEGELIAGVSSLGKREFTNIFTPDPVKVVLEGDKTLTGRELNAGEFTFDIDAITEGAPIPARTVTKNDATGHISFGAIYFDEAGTYEYVITERADSLPGVTYDNNEVKAIIKVEYDPSKGAYTADVTYDKAGENAFVFNNEYKAAPVSVNINADKSVTASEGNSYTMEAGKFIFEIDPAAENPASDPIGRQNITHDANGTISIEGQFTEAGTYIYTLHEASGDHTGMVFDTSVYRIEVTVTDDVETGKLVADVVVTKDGDEVDEIVFNNEYIPEKTSAEIHGHKHIEGKALENGEFSFTIKALTENAPLPTETTVKNTDTGLFQFGAIVYDQVGTYEYEVSEVNEGKGGYSYDDSVYTVTVTVTDEVGMLEAAVDGVYTNSYEPVIVFNNSYKPDDVTVTIGGNKDFVKNLDGREIKEGEFEFALMDGETTIDTAKNDAEGYFQFNVNFTKAGTYNYTVVEKNTGVAGVEYDTDIYGVVFEVVDEDGKLKVESIDYLKDNSEADKVVFENTYSPAPTQIQLSALKVLEGRELADGEFTFALEDADGKVLQTVQNAEDGTVTFEPIEYAETGTYTYKMYEEKGSLKDVAYDETVHEIVVEVTDDLNGNLTATVTNENAVPVFVNTYEPDNDFGGGDGNGTKTGDPSNMLPLMALATLSMIGAVASLLFRRKKA